MDIKDGLTRKNFKVPIQKSMDENQKINLKVQTDWDIFKPLLDIYNSTHSPMVKCHIQLVFEKEII